MDDMIKQAKLKALSLLNYSDRTESQLRQKLKENSFEEEAIEKAVAYVKSFGYVNDKGYAQRYILNKQGTKSKREIYASLCQKGISRAVVEEAIEEFYEGENELMTIQKLCVKKHYDAGHATEEEKRRMYQFLVRKGFRNEDIYRALNFEGREY